MATSINEAYGSFEFFSGDETLVQSLTNLHLGSGRSGQTGKDFGLSDGYLMNPIWGLRKDEFFHGVCQWRCEDEVGGVGKGGNLSSVKECGDFDFMSRNESFNLAPCRSSFCSLENACVDNQWEYVSQEKSPYSGEGKDWFLNNGTVSFYGNGQRREVSDFGKGGNYLFPASMWDFEDEMKCGVPLEEENVNQNLKSNEVVYIASSKEGSQYLQSVLAVGGEEVMNIVFDGVYDKVYEVMTDPYGQHLFQKIFDVCTDSQQEKLVLKMVSDETSLILAAKNQHGSHSLQKLVKKLKGSHFVKQILSSLALDMKSLMVSHYGKHVIQQCFILLDSRKCQVLYEALLRCCIELATDAVGCTALNNSIKNIKGPHRDHLLSILVENSAFLSQDPSGNFVLQYILSLRNPTLSKQICYHLQGQFIHLSLHKSGSHLVEKCLKSPGMDYVITDFMANQKQLLQLARDQFGNYVLQTALRVARCHDWKMHHFLLQALEPHVLSIRYHPIGRNVYNAINGCVPLPRWGREKSSLQGLTFSGKNVRGPSINCRPMAAV